MLTIFVALGKIKSIKNRTRYISFLNITDASQKYFQYGPKYSYIIWTSSDYSHSHTGLEGSLGQQQSCPSSQQLQEKKKKKDNKKDKKEIVVRMIIQL